MPQDIELKDHVKAALARDPRLPETPIDVEVTDGWLTLRGEVRHQHESDAAYDEVSRLEGVGGITNAITVVTAPRMA